MLIERQFHLEHDETNRMDWLSALLGWHVCIGGGRVVRFGILALGWGTLLTLGSLARLHIASQTCLKKLSRPSISVTKQKCFRDGLRKLAALSDSSSQTRPVFQIQYSEKWVTSGLHHWQGILQRWYVSMPNNDRNRDRNATVSFSRSTSMQGMRCSFFLVFNLWTSTSRLAAIEENIPERLRHGLVLTPCFKDVGRRDSKFEVLLACDTRSGQNLSRSDSSLFSDSTVFQAVSMAVFSWLHAQSTGSYLKMLQLMFEPLSVVQGVSVKSNLSSYKLQSINFLLFSAVCCSGVNSHLYMACCWCQFLPAWRYASAGLCESNVSVRPSLTRRYCIKTKKASIMISSPSGSSSILVFWFQI